MGTKYTYNDDTTTSGATINTLSDKTLAYYEYVDEDPYLRVLSCTAAGTLQDITIGSGGSLVTFRCKTVVSNLLVSGNSANTSITMSSGGPVISGLTVRGDGAKITLGGVEIYDIDIRPNSGARVSLSDSWTAAKIVGGYIESTTLSMSRGTIKNVTVGTNTYVNLYGSAGTDLSIGGHFVSGRVESGGQIKVWSSGGSVASTTFNSANLYMFGAEMGIAAVNRARAKDLVFENGAYFGNGGSSFDTKKYHSGGTATNLTFRTGATMGVYSGGYVSHVTLSGESTQITISGAARVEDVTVQSGSIIKFAGGAWKNDWNYWRTSNQFASNVTIESGGTADMANYGMLMDVTAVAGARITRPANLIGFGGENTNIAKGVIDNNELGADFQVVGGTATGMNLTINAAGRSAFIIYSGLTVSGATITSGGSLFLFDGANANDIDVYGSSGTKRAVISMWNAGGANVSIGSGATLSIESNGAVLNGVSIFGNAYYAADKKVSGAGLVNMKGGTVSGLVISGGTMTTVANANQKTIYNIDVTNDNNGAARTGNADIGILNISSGTYVSGGSIYKRAQLNLRQGVVEDVHFGADTWNNIYAGGSILGGVASNGADFRMGYGNSGALIDGMLFLGNAKVHMRDSRATVKNVVMSGNQNCQIDVSAGVVSSATLWAGALNISGGTAVSASTVTSLGKGIANDTLIRSAGKILQSGGTMTNTSIYAGGSNLYIYDAFADDGETVMSNLTMVGVGSAGNNISSGCAWGSIYGGRIDGGELRRALLAIHGGTVENVNFGEYTWINTYDEPSVLNNCTASSGTVIRGRAGATFNGLTLTDSGTVLQFSGGTVNNVTLRNGASMYVSGGAVLTSATVADGGIIRLLAGATATSVGLSSGGTMYLSGLAKVTGITAEEGALVSLDLTGKTAGSANFDSLANVNSVTILNHTPTAGTYTLADVGNTSLKVGIVGSRVFDGEVAAGSSYIDPFIQLQFDLNAAGTELGVSSYTRTATGEAATFAQSGSVINGGDKALEWNAANVAGKVEMIAASDTVAGNAWLDIRSAVSGAGAQIFGTAENVTFGGKISYQIHGTGGTIGNLAAGANYGGSVKGVDILAYGNTFAGVGYAGGFGTVGEDGVQVVFGNKDTLKKDFYGGALYNAAKVAAGTSTSVSSIDMQFGESAGSVDLVVSGNIYGGGAVKAGTITTTENTSALQTVGDITLTLLAGTATKGAQACVFAGGYATGHDTAKQAPVYTVESVTLTVAGGDWGAAAGGRGIFGGAMASDNIGTDGVYAMVGDVNISISGGTMGNVFGGGWAQKGAFSRVGDVYITISGGTIANVFGGGSTSTSGGSTQAGDVTITVSGGTISGDIFARGQSATDVVNSAEVIFTGANDFACGVYGYSYVGGATASDATLTFTDYTGTFSGALGGFADVTVAGDSWMTLGTAAADVSNGAWIFDFNERELGLDGQAALTWSTADFTEDTITLRIATTRSEGWTLVSGAAASAFNTDADKFLVEIDGAEAIALTFDAATGKTGAIADGAYAGWGFAVEDSVLKFKNLA